MRIDILTLFPDICKGLLNYGVVGRAIDNNIIQFNTINIRDHSLNKHKKVDDEIYGGGAGMLMTPQPIYDSIESVRNEDSFIIYMSPQGKVLDQNIVENLSKKKHIIFLCGHYEGIDARITNHFIDMELSCGDYVLTGGELPAMIAVDAISRFIPGVLGNEESAITDSHYNILLQEDQYTRPREFRGYTVPEILLSGNHQKIKEWREENSLLNTERKRKDLFEIYKKR